MEDIYALLNINKGVLQDFHLLAERAVDHQTELAINRSMRTLKDIEECMMTDKSVTVPQQTIDEIMMKVIKNAKMDNTDMSIWSIRELRIVSYYLMKLQGNEQTYMYALRLLDSNWRDMFFNGLSFYCLDTWNMIVPELRMFTCELLTNKLQQYNGGNKKYMAIKNHANLFDEAGPRRMCVLLSQKKQDLREAPNYFSNKPFTISQSYYSDVIINFFDANKITDLAYVESILELHKADRTKKLIFADLVFRINNYGDDVKRTQLCKFANRILGDITLASTWAPFLGATEKDAEKLKKAKQLVNLWFNQKIIETFFEVCVQDRARKVFWLKYVSYVSCFKIIGSTATKRLLQGDSRVSGIFLPHYIETSSYASLTSALVLFIKNKMIVEFSDTGALYVYNQSHAMAKLVTSKKCKISSIADLKIPSMNNLIYISDWGYKTNYEEGRMTHQGYWQGRLQDWLQEKVISAYNTSMSFMDSLDNNLFKAKPIPKEEFKPSSKAMQMTLFDDVPEYLQQRSSTVSEIKSVEQKVSKPSISPIPKAKQAVYEFDVSFSLSSKLIANGRCRIVCSHKGFYVQIMRESQFVHLRSLVDGVKPTGSIWVRKPNGSGWQEILHSVYGRELSIGYVKQSAGVLLYRQELRQNDFMTIKL